MITNKQYEYDYSVKLNTITQLLVSSISSWVSKQMHIEIHYSTLQPSFLVVSSFFTYIYTDVKLSTQLLIKGYEEGSP